MTIHIIKNKLTLQRENSSKQQRDFNIISITE